MEMAKKFKLDVCQSVTFAAFNYITDNIGEGELMQEFDMNESFEFEISMAYGLMAQHWHKIDGIPVNELFYALCKEMPYTQEEFDKVLHPFQIKYGDYPDG